MKTIKLSQNKIALIDDEDFDRMNQYKWHAYEKKNCKGSWYAMGNVKNHEGKWTTIMFHRFLMNIIDPKIEIDHADGNGLNNQKSNLRAVDHQHNSQNRRLGKNNTSGFKGVFFDKRCKNRPWRAVVTVNGKRLHLGNFSTPEDAYEVYKAKAKESFGIFYREI